MGEKISFIDLFGTELEIEDEYAREQLADESAARAEDVAVLSARMDTFTALPDGSTAGDAELTDIRVGADGTTYANAGDAVRGQVSALTDNFEKLANNIIQTKWEHGAIIRASGLPTSSGYQYRIRTADFVTFSQHQTFTIDDDYELVVFTYGNDDSFISADDYRHSYVTPTSTKLKFVIQKITEDTSSIANISDFCFSVLSYHIPFDGLEYIGGEWCNGNTDYSSGLYYNNNEKRLSTPFFVEFPNDTLFTINDGYILLVNKFDAEGTLVGSRENYVKEFTANANYKYTFTIKKSNETTDTIASQEFRKQIFKSIDYSLGTYRQNLSNVKKLTAFKNLGNEVFDSIFAPMAKFSKNVYDPYYLKEGVRADVSTGKDIEASDYNQYTIIVPGHKQFVCSCLLDNGTTRQFNYSTRSYVVYDTNGNMLSSNTSDNNSYKYVNSSDDTRIVKINIWSDTNSYHTVRDFMIEMLDDTFNTTGYTSEFVPYGLELHQNYTHLIPQELHAPRDYFADEIEDTVNKVRTLQNNVNYTFAFVTDTHYDPASDESYRCTVDTFSNLKAMSELVPINSLFHGGDWLIVSNRTQEQANAEIGKMRNWMLCCNTFGNVHLTPGNHDGVNGGAPEASVLYSPMMTHDENFVKRNGTDYNYYIDIQKPKLRVIVLNDCNPVGVENGITSASLEWLRTVLNTVPTDTNVIIISHIGPQSEDFTLNKTETIALLNNWNNHTGEYSTNNGKIAGWIVGHQHYDWVVPSLSSGCDFPVLVNTCSFRNAISPGTSETEAGAVIVSPRTYKTKLQDAWTIFVYRPDLGTINGIRFGAGGDCVVDYDNWN